MQYLLGFVYNSSPNAKKKSSPLHHPLTLLSFHLLVLEADSRILSFPPGYYVKRVTINSLQPTHMKISHWIRSVLQGGPF